MMNTIPYLRLILSFGVFFIVNSAFAEEGRISFCFSASASIIETDNPLNKYIVKSDSGCSQGRDLINHNIKVKELTEEANRKNIIFRQAYERLSNRSTEARLKIQELKQKENSASLNLEDARKKGQIDAERQIAEKDNKWQYGNNIVVSEINELNKVIKNLEKDN